MEESLIAILLADDDVSALVGDRVQAMVRPQATALPAITVQRVGGRRGYHSIGADGLVSSRLQLDAWGLSYADAKRTARAAVGALSGVRGKHFGTCFAGIFVDDEADDFASGGNSQNGQPERFFRSRIDLIIWHHGD